MNVVNKKKPTQGTCEFIALMALMMSLVALSIDVMLPAMADIGHDLRVVQDNDRQLIISALFVGMAIGQIFYGPVADAIGRKKPVYFGFALFIIGCLISALATSFEIMLIGRVLQGVGVAGPRIITVVLIRDQYSGDAMARIMSLVMMAFILVPAIAPALGQAVLFVAGWRMIFWVTIFISLITFIWFLLRQPETLLAKNRTALSWPNFYTGIIEIFTNRAACGYTLAAGLIFGAFVGYLNSAQQMLQELYGLGAQFPLYFAVLALAIGFASWINSRLVLIFGMRRMCRWALLIMSTLSILFFVFIIIIRGNPPFFSLMAYLIGSFSSIGILFANFHSLAMEPMDHIAGTASAVIGSVTTLISLLLGTLIGHAFNETVIPLTVGFIVLSVTSIVVMSWVEYDK